MARSRGPIYIADNSVTAINDALQQLLSMIDELKGESDLPAIPVGPHTHAGDPDDEDGGPIDFPAQSADHDDLTNVTTDQHHAKLHETLHREGGADELKLDDLGIPEDNTDLNSDTAKHGLLPKLSGNPNEFLNGSGAFASVTAAEATDIANVEGDATAMIWEQVLAGDNITITEVADGSAIIIAGSAGSSGGAGKQFILMWGDLNG